MAHDSALRTPNHHIIIDFRILIIFIDLVKENNGIVTVIHSEEHI